MLLDGKQVMLEVKKALKETSFLNYFTVQSQKALKGIFENKFTSLEKSPK